MNENRRKILLGVLAIALLMLLFSSKSRPTPRIPEIKLVLFVVADQFPQEYLQRFRPLLKGGVATLLERGAIFTNARFQHADTATCPGHAALLSGTYPSTSGIISNWWYDRETGEDTYCVYDPQFRRSPSNLEVNTLGDWLKQQYGKGQVFSASAKDRAAVIMGGKRADAALWYDKESGEFATSGYYTYRRPDSTWHDNGKNKGWLTEFNEQRKLDSLFGSLWRPLPVEQTKLEQTKIIDFDQGVFPKKFPHKLGSASIAPNDSFYKDVYSSPYMDVYLADLASTIIRKAKLGQGETPDMLTLSFSALDSVGHGYGPNSREVLDTLLRFDATLGEFFGYLDEHIGLEHVLIAFSADHGVQPYPEVWRHFGREVGHRQNSVDVACTQQVWSAVRRQYGDTKLLLADGLLNLKEMDERGVDRDEIESLVVRTLERCSMIEKVWLASKLQRGEYDREERFLKQFSNGFYPDRSPDFIPQLKHLHLHSLVSGTGHGSPYDYDTHVPLIFMHPSIPARKISREVALVDAAPTLASMLGLRIPDYVDGRDLSEVLFE